MPSAALLLQSSDARSRAQNYLNYIFVDPPFDPQYDSGTSFILSKKRRRQLLREKTASNATAAVDANAQFPFGQAACVHTCMADDYRFTQRHAEHPTLGSRPAPGAFKVPVFDILMQDETIMAASDAAQVATAASAKERRSALDIGPFTLPNIPSLQDKLDMARMQIRTTIQNFLNLRVRATLTPFALVSAVGRFGTQIQQRLNNAPVEIQLYGHVFGA